MRVATIFGRSGIRPSITLSMRAFVRLPERSENEVTTIQQYSRCGLDFLAMISSDLSIFMFGRLSQPTFKTELCIDTYSRQIIRHLFFEATFQRTTPNIGAKLALGA